MALPSHAKYLIIGAGIHGLSTAYHLALELKSREGSGRDIPVLDQGRPRMCRCGRTGAARKAPSA